MAILDDPKRLTARDAELARLKDELRRALAVLWPKFTPEQKRPIIESIVEKIVVAGQLNRHKLLLYAIF